jgi:hypothetical protein
LPRIIGVRVTLSGWDGRPETLPNETKRYLTAILGEGWPDPNIPVFDGGYRFPVVGYTGRVNNHWDTSERGGSDIFGGLGAEIVAVRGGRVAYAGYDKLGGNNVLIEGDDGRTYYYAHMLRIPLVHTGQSVNTGTQLGLLGESGNAAGTGPHLHIGIGHGIVDGGGAQGGCGRNFDAVGLLQGILDGTIEEGEDMARIAELEAEVEALNNQLASERSWSGSIIEDTLKPSIEQLESLSNTDTKAEILDTLAQVSGNLRVLAYGE